MNKDFKFRVSLTIDRFADKQDVKNHIKTLQYREEEHTTESLLYELTHGKALCQLFHVSRETFTNSQKTKENFKGSYVICCDIDKTHYLSVKDYINDLKLKPTLYYTTFSHLRDGENIKFRLLYVVDRMIDNTHLFKYLGEKLTKRIENDTNEKFEDRCGTSCAQYFNGTNVDNLDLKVEYGNFDIIYTFEDLGFSTEDYTDFLNSERTSYGKSGFDTGVVGNNSETQSCPTPNFSPSITRLLYQWDNMDVDSFIDLREWKYVRNNTRYIYRIEKDDWKNDRCQEVDEDYFRLFWDKRTLTDGCKRRKNLFERMCLRRVMYPEITRDELVVNSLIDTIRFVNNDDKVINSKFIRDNVETCISMDIDKIKETYRETIEYLKRETTPKRGVIYRNKEVRSRQWTFRFLDEHYDLGMNVRENMINLKECYEFDVGLSTLYEYCQVRGINTKPDKLTDDELMDLIDVDLSVRKNRRIIHDKHHITIGQKRLSELVKRKKNEYMNNHQILSQGTVEINGDYLSMSDLYYINEFYGESVTLFPYGNKTNPHTNILVRKKCNTLTFSKEMKEINDNTSTSGVSGANGENRTCELLDYTCNHPMSVRV